MGRGTISVTPEVTKPRSAARRNSKGNASTTVSPSLLSSVKESIPNYLRASTGSCHDFCKYGIKHGFEAKKRLPICNKLLRNNRIPDEKQNQAEVLTSEKRRKRLDLKSKQSLTIHGCTDEVVTCKDLPPVKVIQISDTSTNQVEASAEEPLGIKLESLSSNLTTVASLGHRLANPAEESSEGSVTINLVAPSHIQKSSTPGEHKFPAEGSYEESARIMLDASNTQKGIVFAEHKPVTPVEKLDVEHASTKLLVSPWTKTGIAFTKQVVSSLVEESSEVHEIIKSPVQESIAYAENAPTNQAEGLSVQKSIASTEYTSADQAERLSEEQGQVKISNPGDRKKREVNKLKTEQRKAEVSVRAKVIKQKTTDAFVKKNASPLMKIIASVKPTSAVQKSPSSVNNPIAPLAHKIIKQRAPSTLKAGNVSAEPATSLKQKESTSPSISTGGLNGQRNLEKKSMRSPDKSKSGKEIVLKPLKTSVLTKSPVNRVSSTKLRKFRNTKPSSPVKTEAKIGKVDSSAEKIVEKTLYTVELKPGKVDQKIIKQKPSKHFSLSASSLMSSASVSSHDSESIVSRVDVFASDKERNERSKTNVSNGKNKRTPSRTRRVHSEVLSPTPYKLKFRSGKLADLQSENNSLRNENNSLRKLRLRPAKVVSENQNGKELGRRNLRKQTCAAASSTPTPDSQAVVLRHQDVQDKKDIQGLFNHVIEETASKLVETRRSKVKALVGAFETVISLQENKLAPAVAVP